MKQRCVGARIGFWASALRGSGGRALQLHLGLRFFGRAPEDAPFNPSSAGSGCASQSPRDPGKGTAFSTLGHFQGVLSALHGSFYSLEMPHFDPARVLGPPRTLRGDIQRGGGGEVVGSVRFAAPRRIHSWRQAGFRRGDQQAHGPRRRRRHPPDSGSKSMSGTTETTEATETATRPFRATRRVAHHNR